MDFKNEFDDYKNMFLESKKYWIIYLVFITIACVSMIQPMNFLDPSFEIGMFVLIALLGTFCIIYYFKHNSDEELYKVAFVVIICFGLICAMIVPIASVSDEKEHLVRSEITSQGVLFPHWTGEDVGLERLYNYSEHNPKALYNDGVGYQTIGSMKFYDDNRNLQVYQTDGDTDKINYSSHIYHSAFEQNPFWGYLPQAFGILVAKLLDLNVIWLMWMGRIFNLICYAGLISLAVKKIPTLKMPLLAVACIPLAVYQASSLSIDSLIFGLGIFLVAYFIYMCKSEDGSLNYKHIALFTGVSIIFGLCKLPYLAFILLMFFVPRRKFSYDVKYVHLVLLACLAVVGVIGWTWGNYSQNALLHSWRSFHHFNSTQQISYLSSHPMDILSFINRIFNLDLFNLSGQFFNFYNSTETVHYNDGYHLISIVLNIFLAVMLFAYPCKTKFDSKTKIGAFLVLFIVYVGTSIVQLLSWADVGKNNLGMSLRYFIPLLALFPVIFRINYSVENKGNFNKYAFVFIVGFLGALILSFATKYY